MTSQRSPSDAHDEPIIIGDINEESDTDEQVINQEYANTDDEGVTGRLIEEEEAQTGKVRYGVYLDYFRNFGWLRLCIILALIASGEILDVCGDFWLSHWSNFNEHQNGTDIAHNLGYFLGLYYDNTLMSLTPQLVETPGPMVAHSFWYQGAIGER